MSAETLAAGWMAPVRAVCCHGALTGRQRLAEAAEAGAAGRAVRAAPGAAGAGPGGGAAAEVGAGGARVALVPRRLGAHACLQGGGAGGALPAARGMQHLDELIICTNS